MKKFTQIIYSIIDIFLPPRCLICKEVVYKENGLCPKCFNQIKFLTDQSCPLCGRPYTFPVEDEKQLICGKCLTKTPKLQGIKAVFAYDDFSKNLILPFKHADRTDVVPLLSRMLFTRGRQILDDADFIIPVPLHWRRLLKRKYNQSALLAVELERLTHKKCLLRTLVRVKKTPAQGHKTREERKLNILDAFAVCKPEIIKGRKIVLIDDVYTTGATLNECAKVLRKAGAKEVKALVLARVCRFE